MAGDATLRPRRWSRSIPLRLASSAIEPAKCAAKDANAEWTEVFEFLAALSRGFRCRLLRCAVNKFARCLLPRGMIYRKSARHQNPIMLSELKRDRTFIVWHNNTIIKSLRGASLEDFSSMRYKSRDVNSLNCKPNKKFDVPYQLSIDLLTIVHASWSHHYGNPIEFHTWIMRGRSRSR